LNNEKSIREGGKPLIYIRNIDFDRFCSATQHFETFPDNRVYALISKDFSSDEQHIRVTGPF